MGKTIKDNPSQKGKKGTDGRPETELNMKTLIQCAKIQCTKEEAAAVCEVSADTLERRLREEGTNWTEFFKEHGLSGRASLRRAMFKNAIEGNNPTLQVWLSKQHLDMKDKTEHGFDPQKPVKFVLNMGKDISKGEGDV